VQQRGLLTEHSRSSTAGGYDAGGTRQQFSTDYCPTASTSRPDHVHVIASASWEVDLWVASAADRSAQANLLATDEARPVSFSRWSPGGTTTDVRALDEHSSREEDARTYAESLKIFELQFKYGVCRR